MSYFSQQLDSLITTEKYYNIVVEDYNIFTASKDDDGYKNKQINK